MPVPSRVIKHNKVRSNVTFKSFQSYESDQFYNVYEADSNIETRRLNKTQNKNNPSKEDFSLLSKTQFDNIYLSDVSDSIEEISPVCIRKPLHGMSDMECVKTRFMSLIHLERLSAIVPLLPPLPRPCQTSPTADLVVGLLLHCVILSSLLLMSLVRRVVVVVVKFVCYVSLHYLIYRGNIKPIRDDSNRPITPAELQKATLLYSPGFKLIIISNRPPNDYSNNHDHRRIETPSINTPTIESLPSTPAYSLSLSECSTDDSSSCDHVTTATMSLMSEVNTPQDFNF